ncbi:MAG: FHA domain-containing protein [Dokdonella sp.]
MDEMSWIEVSAHQREAPIRQRITTSTLTIGRAYDNDVVLDDPYVAAHHLRLLRAADGIWVAEDLGSVNGLRVEGDAGRRQTVVLDAATVLSIGTTTLRVRAAHDAVAAERRLSRERAHWPLALACFALVFACTLLELWLGQIVEPKLIGYLTPLLALAVMVAIWTSAWSVISRIFTGHARYALHLLIVGVGLLAYTLFAQLGELGAFSLSWTALARFAYVGAWIAFGAVCLAHLRALGTAHVPIKLAAVLALVALGVTMQSLKLSEWRASTGQPIVLQRLQPPSIRLATAQSKTVFFARANDLIPALDKARSEAVDDGESGDSE